MSWRKAPITQSLYVNWVEQQTVPTQTLNFLQVLGIHLLINIWISKIKSIIYDRCFWIAKTNIHAL